MIIERPKLLQACNLYAMEGKETETFNIEDTLLSLWMPFITLNEDYCSVRLTCKKFKEILDCSLVKIIIYPEVRQVEGRIFCGGYVRVNLGDTLTRHPQLKEIVTFCRPGFIGEEVEADELQFFRNGMVPGCNLAGDHEDLIESLRRFKSFEFDYMTKPGGCLEAISPSLIPDIFTALNEKLSRNSSGDVDVKITLPIAEYEQPDENEDEENIFFGDRGHIKYERSLGNGYLSFSGFRKFLYKVDTIFGSSEIMLIDGKSILNVYRNVFKMSKHITSLDFMIIHNYTLLTQHDKVSWHYSVRQCIEDHVKDFVQSFPNLREIHVSSSGLWSFTNGCFVTNPKVFLSDFLDGLGYVLRLNGISPPSDVGFLTGILRNWSGDIFFDFDPLGPHDKLPRRIQFLELIKRLISEDKEDGSIKRIGDLTIKRRIVISLDLGFKCPIDFKPDERSSIYEYPEDIIIVNNELSII